MSSLSKSKASSTSNAASGNSATNSKGKDGAERKTSPSTKVLRINPSQYEGWTPRDAFSEIYRNWRETILQTFAEYETSFEYLEDMRRIMVVAHARSPLWLPSYAGFIQYDKKTQKVVIVAASPDEDFRPLPLQEDQDSRTSPASSVTNSSSSTSLSTYQLNGPNGVALTAAFMVLSLDGQKICIKTKDVTLSFCRRHKWGSSLHCTITPISSDTTANTNQTLTESKGMLTLKFRPLKDIEMTISARKGPGSRSVDENAFKEWLRVALHIQGLSEPTDVVTTPDGDLILDPVFIGKTYRAGILLRSSEANSGLFAYGYNFHREINGAQDEAKILASIWRAAIRQKGEPLLRKYIHVLRDLRICREVADAETNIDTETRKHIWDLLLSEAGDKTFYHRKDVPQDISIITNDLHKEPVGLSEVLWDLLRSACLIRTPEEERLIRLEQDPEIAYETLDSTFSKYVHRLLRSSLDLSKTTSNINVLFVKNTNIDIDLGVDKETGSTTLSINGEWLDYWAIHKRYPCRISSIEGQGRGPGDFYCDHIVESLYNASIEKLFNVSQSHELKEKWEKMFQMVQEKLAEMPRNITWERISSTPTGDTLTISWENLLPEPLFTRLHQNIEYEVTLHNVDEDGNECVDLDYLVQNHPFMADTFCSCKPRKLFCTATSQKCSVTLDLDRPSTQYSAAIVRSDYQAFYGVPTGRLGGSVRTSKNGRESTDPQFVTNPEDTTSNDRREIWGAWNREEFPRIFQSLIPHEDMNTERKHRPLAIFKSERLDWIFERDRSLIVTIISRGSAQKTVEYILRTHGIYPPLEGVDGDEGALLVTRYSYLHQSPFFTARGRGHGKLPSNENEILLYFNDTDAMGTRPDASTIPIQSIMTVKEVDIRHTVDIPEHLKEDGLFCRFAIQSDGPCDTACVMPLASHLLMTSDRWPIPWFNPQLEPKILDLSPRVLGLTEGFYQAGCTVHAGLGFDQRTCMTWKSAYCPVIVCPDTVQSYIPHINRLEMKDPPEGLPSNTPIVAILSIPDKGIAQSGTQRNEDLEVLESIRSILSMSRPVSFIIITFQTWILHDDWRENLNKTVRILLENRFWVQLKKIDFQPHDVPRHGTSLILLASSVPSPVLWDAFDEAAETSALDKIRSLEVRTSNSGFVCTTSDDSTCPDIDVFNHRTSLPVSHASPTPLTALLDMNDVHRTTHPERKDKLTVRELARIQGFSDDFIFKGCVHRQYEEVTQAFPPPVALKLARAVMALIREFGGGSGAGTGSIIVQKGQKRRRLSE